MDDLCPVCRPVEARAGGVEIVPIAVEDNGMRVADLDDQRARDDRSIWSDTVPFG